MFAPLTIDALIAAHASSDTPSTGVNPPPAACFATWPCMWRCIWPIRQFISRWPTSSIEPKRWIRSAYIDSFTVCQWLRSRMP